MKVLVTGGAGYIGSHTVVELLKLDFEVVICDDFSNSRVEMLDRIREISGKTFKFYELDICDMSKLVEVFKVEQVDAVIHFAGYKAVGESCAKPLIYYQNNLISTLNLLECMQVYNVRNLVFSSSATVYGDPVSVPIPETASLSATNPYGRTKLFIEEILVDIAKANNDMNIALLRYFNPIGAHKSGRIGENPNGIPNNLMPFITGVAVGKYEHLSVFGDDYNTSDGTGVRDYIHVCDLARGHILALNKLSTNSGLVTYNLGTGVGYSVLDMVKTFEIVNNVQVPYKIIERRSGDIAVCYADSTKAKLELEFSTEYTLEDMCKDSWHWQMTGAKEL